MKVKIKSTHATRIARRRKLIKELKDEEWNEPFPSSELESSQDASDSSDEESPVTLPVTKPRRDHHNSDKERSVIAQQESQVVA